MDGVTSVHAVATLTAHVGSDSSVILSSETWVDLGPGNAKQVVSEPDPPTSDEFVVTEETVILDGVAYRRSEDSGWLEVTDDIGSIVFTGIDATGDDLAASLRQFTQSEEGNWTATTSGNGLATYRCNDDATTRNVTVNPNGGGRSPGSPRHHRTTKSLRAPIASGLWNV